MMVLQILNKDLPVRNLIFVLGEGVLIYAVVLLSTFARSGTANGLLLSSQVLAKAVVKPLEEFKSPNVLPVGKEDGIVDLYILKTEINRGFQLHLEALKAFPGFLEDPFPQFKLFSPR